MNSNENSKFYFMSSRNLINNVLRNLKLNNMLRFHVGLNFNHRAFKGKIFHRGEDKPRYMYTYKQKNLSLVMKIIKN